MTKKERKKTLLTIEMLLRRGISTNNQTDIVDAYRYLEDALGNEGVYSVSEIPRFPNSLKVERMEREHWSVIK